MLRFLDETTAFPPVHHALQDPNGLLAVGGDLSAERLLSAYQSGIFPWYGQDDPILWWSPDPRAVFTPDSLHYSRSMRRFSRITSFRVTLNQDFVAVIRGCRQAHQASGVWIHDEFIDAYTLLHQQGQAHSVEVWDHDELVGGLYGLGVNSVFTAESMFHQRPNASKLALLTFAQAFFNAGGRCIDAQIENPHLMSLGAINVPRSEFIEQLKASVPNALRDFYQRRQLKIGF